jgi:two-component sensor histidine kinase
MQRPPLRASGPQAELRPARLTTRGPIRELEAENALLRLELAQAASTSEERDLVAKELVHRIANLMAMVQAIARNTFKDADPSSMAEFAGRLGSLATAQKLLLNGDPSATGVDRIVRAALAPHGFDERFTTSGPDVRVSGRQAHALTLALHELATNAAKYGALSVDGGSIEVSWRDLGGAFDFVWREHGGPAVARPTRKGFGTLLISRNLATAFAGEAKIDFWPAGLVFRLRASLTGDL